MFAIADLDRLGVNPIEKLVELAEMNVKAFKEFRGYGDKGDAGVGYLSNATRIYIELAKFKHPTLSAVAIKDIRDDDEKAQSLTTLDAVKIVQNDVLAPNNIKTVTADQVIDAMQSHLEKPILPTGNNDSK